MSLLLESMLFFWAVILLNFEAGVGGVTETCSQVQLKPSGSCEDEDNCQYQINFPPLSIQMPNQFQLLKEAVKELESLKETVRQLKSACLGCSLQKDSAKDTEVRGDGGAGEATKISSNDVIQEMQDKMSNMSDSLMDAHGQIDELQKELEAQRHRNLKEMENMVNKKVENITGMINKSGKNCSHSCAQTSVPAGIRVPTDCSDYSAMGKRKSGVYKITPKPMSSTFEVYCDLESNGGGWTVVQNRFDGSVNFNRTWADYKKGFGYVHGEYWLGNERLHWLTRARTMILRVELEDLDGVHEYAKYDKFYVANEFLKYRLSLGGYSGTAGNAMHGKKDFDHDQKFFTTWDKDNDMYWAGNCGALYGAGWWFNACMSANLNGKYYHKKYKGKRDGIYWDTWHNNFKENYPTTPRQAFKKVRMMIRPENYAP